MLLDPARHPEFVYSFKPTDGGMYGGQPRIDWHACDITGRYWLVEVKQHPDEKHLFNLRTAVSPGQRDALDGVALSTIGIALLAVGCGDYLFVFDWRDIGWRWRSDAQPSQQKLSMTEAKIVYLWKGPKSWMTNKIEALFHAQDCSCQDRQPEAPLLHRRRRRPQAHRQNELSQR
jgi:hypothetical protein